MQKAHRRLVVVLFIAFIMAIGVGGLTIPTAWADTPDGVDTAPAAVAPPAPEVAPQGDPQTFFAIDVRNQEFLTISSAAPQAPTILGGLSDQIFGGDFLSDSYDLLYGVNNTSDQLVTVNTTTGAITNIGSLGAPIGDGTWSGLAWDQTTNTLYASSAAATGAYLYTINPTTGTPTPIGQVTGLNVLIDIAIHPTTGELYGIHTNDDSLYRINKSTAAPTLIGSLNYPADFAQGMDFDDNSGVLYWAAYRGAALGAGSIRTIDLATGNSSELGIIGDGSIIRELDGFAWINTGTPTAVTLADWNVAPATSGAFFLVGGLALLGIAAAWRFRR